MSKPVFFYEQLSPEGARMNRSPLPPTQDIFFLQIDSWGIQILKEFLKTTQFLSHVSFT